MEIDILSDKVKQQLSSWFHRRDRSLYLPPNTFYYLNNGAYLATAFISETILSASATSVTFSNIPQDFRSLMVISSVRTDGAVETDSTLIRFNSDIGSNYDYSEILALGATVSGSVQRGRANIPGPLAEGGNSRGNCFAPGFTIIPHYSISGIEKNALIPITSLIGNLSADADVRINLRQGHWRNTNVITSVTFVPNTGTNFVSGSRFQLYGIL